MISFKKKEKGFINRIELNKPSVKFFYWTVFVAAMLVCMITFIPALWIVLSAFKDTQEFLAVPPSIFPKTFDLNKFRVIWEQYHFERTYLATLTMVLGEVVFCVILNGLAGYVLSRLKPRGHKMVILIVLWTMMMPGSMSMVPLFMSFIDFPVFHFNLADTYVPMWMMAGANAYYTLLFKSFFDSISTAYIEAARIDGCSELGIFWKIVLPSSKPIVMSVAIFTFTGSWGEFFWPYLLISKESLIPIGTKIYLVRGGMRIDHYMVALLFVIVPSAIFFLLFQDYIMKGVNVGGIKG